MTTEEIISKYPKIFEHYEGNPRGVNWFGVPRGWLSIIDSLCGAIQRYCDNPQIEQVTCLQMKEKFGGLRFYTNHSNDVVDGMIRMATHMCDNTCEGCGTTQDLGITSGWISIRCKKCADEVKRNWMTKEDWKAKMKI